MSNADTIGMMNKAYTVPRHEILSWLNEQFDLSLTKIEQLGTGAVYCQIFDYVYPGAIQMSRIAWTAKTEYDYVNNYKLLQKGFEKQNQKKYIEVQKLCKCRYQDNLEFAQWLYALYNQTGGENPDYCPKERRGIVDIDIQGMKINKAGISASDANITKTKTTKMPALNNKMKLNNDAKVQIKLPESKKENQPASQNLAPNSNRASRPIKKITGVNNNVNTSESDELINKIRSIVSNDENPCIMIDNIRSILGVEMSTENWSNLVENGMQANQRVSMIEDQYKQLYMQCQQMHNENKMQKQQIATITSERDQVCEQLQDSNMMNKETDNMDMKQQKQGLNGEHYMEEEHIQNERQTPSNKGSNSKHSMNSPNDANMLLEDDCDEMDPNNEGFDPNEIEHDENLIEG